MTKMSLALLPLAMFSNLFRSISPIGGRAAAPFAKSAHESAVVFVRHGRRNIADGKVGRIEQFARHDEASPVALLGKCRPVLLQPSIEGAGMHGKPTRRGFQRSDAAGKQGP